MKRWVFSFLRKTEGERENKGELRLGWEEVEWDEKCRKSGERLFHKAGAVWWKDLFVILYITCIIQHNHDFCSVAVFQNV